MFLFVRREFWVRDWVDVGWFLIPFGDVGVVIEGR